MINKINKTTINAKPAPYPAPVAPIMKHLLKPFVITYVAKYPLDRYKSPILSKII
jgi:hypothetical protein